MQNATRIALNEVLTSTILCNVADELAIIAREKKRYLSAKDRWKEVNGSDQPYFLFFAGVRVGNPREMSGKAGNAVYMHKLEPAPWRRLSSLFI